MRAGLTSRLCGLVVACVTVTGVACAQPRAEAASPSPPEAPPKPEEAPSEAGAAELPSETEESEPEGPATQPSYWDVSVFGDAREVGRVAGSAHRIDEEQLERFEDDDAERVFTRIAGVYARGEDGYGLRPNIGLRGGNSDRSKKVTLMEDGILFGPAPYSAPAAYYFPLMTRMVAVEAFKGPASVRYGPQTIGGAINLVTRKIPYGHRFGSDLAIGSQTYGKGHAFYGYGDEHWGFLVEGVRLRSDGFKELDGGGETGFDKIETMFKARVNTSPTSEIYNEGTIKLGYSREVSNETYLGLTDADFRENPLRRYRASALDRMEWERFQIEAAHGLVVRDVVTVRTVAYRHDFHRAWFKLNSFADAQPLGDILADPTGRRAIFHDVLTGAADSASADEALLIGTNERTFVSQGIQSSSTWKVPKLWLIDQKIHFGARLHYDSIDRLHTEDSHSMVSGRLERDATPRAVTTDNFADALAFAAYLADDIAVWRFIVSPGIRFEHIRTHFESGDGAVTIDGVQNVLLPGVGLLFQAVDEVAILAGVHQGFSPVAPGQVGVEPEVALNYEGGVRLSTAFASAEAVAFFSDYSNITGECTFSSGCREDDLDQQFNGGSAHIYGVEVSGSADIPTPINLRIPLTLGYTFTQTELLTAFTSDNPQLGDVEPGDEMPYVPKHQLAGTASLVADGWGGFTVGATWIDRMRETAGQGEAAEGELTDSVFFIDLAAYGQILPEVQIYGKVGNVLDNRYIVSRRPFGARPGAPRYAFAGVKVLIDRP
jgi:Fe(3+) dicitrate transport protein